MQRENGRKQKRNFDAGVAIDGQVNRMMREEERSPSDRIEKHRQCHRTERDESLRPPS